MPEDTKKTDNQKVPAETPINKTTAKVMKETSTEDLHQIIKSDEKAVEELNKKVAEKVQEESAEETKDFTVPEKFKLLVEQIEKMSVLDLAELVKVLEEKFGVSAAAPVAVAAIAGAPAGPAETEEKTSFNLELTETGSNKIAVIKALREVTELGLKDAKDLADGAPKIIKEGVPKEEAENMKKKLEEAGAKVELK